MDRSRNLVRIEVTHLFGMLPQQHHWLPSESSAHRRCAPSEQHSAASPMRTHDCASLCAMSHELMSYVAGRRRVSHATWCSSQNRPGSSSPLSRSTSSQASGVAISGQPSASQATRSANCTNHGSDATMSWPSTTPPVAAAAEGVSSRLTVSCSSGAAVRLNRARFRSRLRPPRRDPIEQIVAASWAHSLPDMPSRRTIEHLHLTGTRSTPESDGARPGPIHVLVPAAQSLFHKRPTPRKEPTYHPYHYLPDEGRRSQAVQVTRLPLPRREVLRPLLHWHRGGLDQRLSRGRPHQPPS